MASATPSAVLIPKFSPRNLVRLVVADSVAVHDAQVVCQQGGVSRRDTTSLDQRVAVPNKVPFGDELGAGIERWCKDGTRPALRSTVF